MPRSMLLLVVTTILVSTAGCSTKYECTATNANGNVTAYSEEYAADSEEAAEDECEKDYGGHCSCHEKD